MAGNSAQPRVSVTSRVMAVFGAFDEEHRSLTLTALAGRAGLPLPTAHRFVAELVRHGALVRLPSGVLVVGRRMWELGLLAPVETGLRHVASPFLNDLYGATLETVHLAVRDGASALYVERISGRSSVPVVSQVGGRLPMHSTGVGKVLLAYAPDEIRVEVLGNLGRHTPYTVTQPGLLAEQLRRVRCDGYATTREEMTLGACSVAVPIQDRRGATVAAVGIVVADLETNQSRLVAALKVAARGIGRSLP
ncbi:IclR family transcriptional regulator [Actinoplanes sp. NPDC051513]|uniref:IclR family transcriptional regulator n=1 Tax=Actinoplanes sp. NPDC051513 TaxID=3363908 RepID=UPI0037925568